MIDIYLATEDTLSEAVAKKLILDLDRSINIEVSIPGRGANGLRSKLATLLRTSRYYPVLMIADLDSAECPPSLISNWMGGMSLTPNFLFRVSVREIESWVLADAISFSEYSGVPIHRITCNPDSLADPKAELMRLVDRHGERQVKRDLLPMRGSGASKGLGYNNSLSFYVANSWSSRRASLNSGSLDRSIRRLEAFFT